MVAHEVATMGRKEGNVLFKDALNTFYLWLYGVKHMVKDHSDSERGNPLPPHRLLFLIAARVLLYASSHRQDSTYHSLCYASRGPLAGTRNSSMGRLYSSAFHWFTFSMFYDFVGLSSLLYLFKFSLNQNKTR